MKKVKKAVENAVATGSEQQPTASTPTATEIDACKKLVDAAMKSFDRGGPAMTAVDRSRIVRVRKGGEKYIPKLARAAVDNHIAPNGFSIDAMTVSAALVQKLEPLEETLSTLLKLVQDARLQASGATWTTATLVYSMLKPIAARDGKVATAISPVTQFFALGKRAPKDGVPAKGKAAPTTPATETATTPDTAVETSTTTAAPAVAVAGATPTHA
jgi:hypothetical protein